MVNKFDYWYTLILTIAIVILTGATLQLRNSTAELKDTVSRQKNEIHQQKNEITRLKAKRVFSLTWTAYSSDPSQTDSTPFETAFLTKVKPWTVALSWDLFEAGWTPGHCVYGDGIGVLGVNDRMNNKWSYRVDAYFENNDHAIQFGIKRNVTTMLIDCDYAEEYIKLKRINELFNGVIERI